MTKEEPARPPIDIPTESAMIPIGELPISSKTGEQVLAKHTFEASSKLMLDALAAGDYIEFLETLREVLKICYRYRFIDSLTAVYFLAFAEKYVDIHRQKETQKNIYDKYPDTSLKLASMAESVSSGADGMLKLGYKCKIVQAKGPKTYAKMMEICLKCGKRDEDSIRVQHGKKRLCKISLQVPNFFGNIEQMPILDTFKTGIVQWPEKWYTIQLERFKELIRDWRSVDFSWYTREMKIEEDEEWRRTNPLGILIHDGLHEPTIKFTKAILELSEGPKWLNWRIMNNKLEKKKKNPE